MSVFDLTTESGTKRFLENVQEAQENGYDLICAICGAGIFDDNDMHDSGCNHFPEGGY